MQTLALTDGASLLGWTKTIAGNVFLIILLVRAVMHYAKREWGEMIGHIIAGVIVAGFVFATDQTKTLLTDIWNKVAG
ncbi:hypothetical protein [Streptomyces sp. NRRL S-87]|uniref:hypothetical protein n=1 Tax=Streptomyces sp. NRRL S-87 TaxID=1463920 RepID=UPI0004BF26DD|nr:hypothetical protein [Streptomyces sp. NRRL S-87]